MEYELELLSRARNESLKFLLQADKSWRAEWDGHVLRLEMQDYPDNPLWGIYVDGLLVREVDGLPPQWHWQGKPEPVSLPQLKLGSSLLRPFSIFRIVLVALVFLWISRSCGN